MLVEKVRRLPNWQHEWKLVTILIGIYIHMPSRVNEAFANYCHISSVTEPEPKEAASFWQSRSLNFTRCGSGSDVSGSDGSGSKADV
jgi:hypothetical protein